MKTKKLNQWECGITHHRGETDPCELCGKKQPTPAASHTPTLLIHSENHPKDIINDKGDLIARCVNTVDAAFIVKACNAYEPLVGIVSEIKQNIVMISELIPEPLWKRIEQALAKAGDGSI